MKTNYISHNRHRCIGCGVCARIAPDRWIMNEKDGKASLLGGRKKGSTFLATIMPFEIEANRQAAMECPVNVIHIPGINTRTKNNMIHEPAQT